MTTRRTNPTWIWYYGDFEIHQHMLMGLQREERGNIVPAFWKLFDCNRLIRFTKRGRLEQDETIAVTMDGVGYVSINGARQPVRDDNRHLVKAGDYVLTVIVGNATGLPSVFVQGDTIISDETWRADSLARDESPVGCWNLDDPGVPPSKFSLPCEPIQPVGRVKVEQGELYDFGQETFGKLVIDGAELGAVLRIYYGESREEALHREKTVIRDCVTIEGPQHVLPARAFRYVYVESEGEPGTLSGLYEYLPLEKRGAFQCSNETLNSIYGVSLYTLELCSRLFFLDGIKRDRWVWSGDAYQSYLLDYYSFFDQDIIKRTILALRGKDPVPSHINTIVDYSFYWLISIWDYYHHTGDGEFVSQIYPRMKSLMEYCISRGNKDGLIEGQGNWVFIDWADMEKDGALCAMQMLYCKALESTSQCAALLGLQEDRERYGERAAKIREMILRLSWNEERGAFVTTCRDGQPSQQIRRHANLFAIIFGFAGEEMAQRIKTSVILNSEVPPITTPYFKFYELEALCKMGEYPTVLAQMESYWGGMLREGATTFWEEYDPTLTGVEQCAMYDQPFDKSFCHAWGASPVYLLGRYFLGVEPTKVGYAEFQVRPQLGGLAAMGGTVPLPDGKSVTVQVEGARVEVVTDAESGTLVLGERRFPIVPGQPLTVEG